MVVFVVVVVDNVVVVVVDNVVVGVVDNVVVAVSVVTFAAFVVVNVVVVGDGVIISESVEICLIRQSFHQYL